MAAPTLTDFQQSTWSDLVGTSEVTPTVTWSAGDLVLVVGLTEDRSITLGAPTAPGLTFQVHPACGPNTTLASTLNSVRVYAWYAIAAAGGSGVITATTDGTVNKMRGIAAYVFGSHRGLGGIAFINPPTTDSSTGVAESVIALRKLGLNSRVVFILGDWSANADVTVTTVPASGGTQRIAVTNASHCTAFLVDWTDQGARGVDNFGIAAFAGVTNNIMAAIEILGTPANDRIYRRMAPTQRM